MNPFIETMPDDMKAKLQIPEGEEILIQVATDLDDTRGFGQQWVVVTDKQMLVIPTNGQNRTMSVPLSEVSEIKQEELVGSGYLELRRKEGPPVQVPYSRSLTPKFAEVLEALRQLKDGEEVTLPQEFERTHCEACGRLLPEKNGICPVCLKKWVTFRRIVGYMFRYRWRVILTMFLSVVSALLALLPPHIIQLIIDDVLTPRTDQGLLFQYVMMMFGIRVAIFLVDLTVRCVGRAVGLRSIGDVREDLYRQFQLLPIKFYDKRRVGALVSRMTNDSDRLEGLMVYDFYYILSNTLLFFGILALLMVKNWELTVYVLLPIPLIVFAGSRIWDRMILHWSKWSSKWSKLYAQLNESMHGIRVVKAFAQESREGDRFDHHNEEMMQVNVVGERTWFVFFTITNFLMSFGVFFVWFFGGQQILQKELTLGVLIAFISYLWMLYQPLRWFGDFYNFILRALAGAERIFEVIDSTPEPFDKPGVQRMPRIKGDLTFRNVFFGYDPGKPVLKGVDLEVKAGEMIGLVGKSGVGKSTLINLVCRFYDPLRGVVEVDGVDMRDIHLNDLRSQIGMVHQEPFLFDGTIAENIAYGKREATFEDVVRAAIAAEAHEFVVQKPDGYDMKVGERGGRLSGGERQRISIARAILHDPRILILDEATSSLDTQTERKIQQAIARLVEGRTTFAIAHRLSTLRSANRLVVIDEGRVAEVGTHEELMDRQGIFYRLVKKQQETSAVLGVGALDG
ncbi:MAG: ABC transporter transmembrane domain-containing protein [bacterium]|nr:ABC transporter transmembrane domain-containing protein [bacterium]